MAKRNGGPMPLLERGLHRTFAEFGDAGYRHLTRITDDAEFDRVKTSDFAGLDIGMDEACRCADIVVVEESSREAQACPYGEDYVCLLGEFTRHG